MAKEKFYVVWSGGTPGIYRNWEDCRQQVQGVAGAKYKSFNTLIEAQEAFNSSYENALDKDVKNTSFKLLPIDEQPILNSIAVDAACSGNPGVTEYQGVYTDTGTQVFYFKIDEATNNIGEFLAIVHGLSYIQKHKLDLPLYTDSNTAIAWVMAKQCRTKFEKTDKNKKVFELITRAEEWLKDNIYHTKILKWDTKKWGEIPADFGRK